MVALIGELVDAGQAYETDDGVYFQAEQVPDYGLLARQPLESLRAGARVEANDEKRSPIDFALWKKAKPGEPSWPSPWGDGRPGWHTECVVMSLDLLGDGFDIHGGGQDLAFPHHENERAQAVALGKRFANHWMHNGFVEIDGEKMSKSLGNFTNLLDLIDSTDPRAYRLLLLRSHYRTPVEVTGATADDASAALRRLDTFVRRAGELPAAEPEAELLDEYRRLMDDDLNTPGGPQPAVRASCAGATRPSTPTTTRTRRRCWPPCARSPRPWASSQTSARARRADPLVGRGLGTGAPSATRPGRPRTGPGPTRCGPSRLSGPGLPGRGHAGRHPDPPGLSPPASPSARFDRAVPVTFAGAVSGPSCARPRRPSAARPLHQVLGGPATPPPCASVTPAAGPGPANRHPRPGALARCGASIVDSGRRYRLAGRREIGRAPLPPGFGTIWMTVAIDLVGFGIVLPILPQYAERRFHVSSATCHRPGWWPRTRWPSSPSRRCGGGCRTVSGRKPILIISPLCRHGHRQPADRAGGRHPAAVRGSADRRRLRRQRVGGPGVGRRRMAEPGAPAPG